MRDSVGGGELGRRGETTKRPRNTTQARYSQVALSKIRLHYLPYFQSIFSWCGFVANFCFLPKYINPLFALNVNNVGRCWQWHAPSLDWEQTARPSPISYLFQPVSHSPKIFFFDILSLSTYSSFSEDIIFLINPEMWHYMQRIHQSSTFINNLETLLLKGKYKNLQTPHQCLESLLGLNNSLTRTFFDR